MPPKTRLKIQGRLKQAALLDASSPPAQPWAIYLGHSPPTTSVTQRKTT